MKMDSLIQNNFIQNKSLFDMANPANNASSVKNDNNGLSFVDTLKGQLDDVNSQQLEADAVTAAFIKGDNVDVHQVMISTEEAKQSLQMAVQIRNKLVEAFQEINKMQL
jgi:flagellar hook-basal body complex protein FliE